MIKNSQLSINMIKLIRVLADLKFHTGSEIGEYLDVSRTAIWKQVKQLENLGITIEKSQVYGYRLLKPLVLIEKKQIVNAINSKEILKLCNFKLLSSVTSTNDYLKSKKNSNQFDFCIAEQQTQGRGRFNRVWFSPFADNIYLSCSWQLHRDVSELSGISLILGMIITDALSIYGIKSPLKVKWPNDVYCNKQKIAGSLIEVIAEANGITRLILGIGINVNMLDDLQSEISTSWTSLAKITNNYHNRNTIIGILIKCLVEGLKKFSEKGFQSYFDKWKHYDLIDNQEINVLLNKKTIAGVAKGINKQGHLAVQLSSGQLNYYTSGDVSIRF